MMYELENEYIKIQINSLGAELRSLISLENGREYLWLADPAYWKRTSPILFPLVGRFKNNQFTYDGKNYNMSQHGFARDRQFELLDSDNKHKIALVLNSDSLTYENYPFNFKLIIEYELIARKVQVRWRVINMDNKIMHFSIGAHPAFMCPIDEADMCKLQFNIKDNLQYKLLGKDSLLLDKVYDLPLIEGKWQFTKDVFAHDALVFEDYQIKEVAMLDNNDKPYLTMHFAAPVTGIWSPPNKNAPFICIEPWYGRCDAADFSGNLNDREYGNSIAGGAEFAAHYDIEIYS